MVCEVDSAVTVAEWYPGHIPEDQHESQLLVIHIPSRDDAFFALGTRVRVQEVRKQQEADLTAHIPVDLVLSCCRAEREEEEDIPRYADLEEHLEVEHPEGPRVQLCAHEEVVNRIACHAVLRSPCNRAEVGDNGHQEAGDDGHRHERPKLVDDGVQLEQPRYM